MTLSEARKHYRVEELEGDPEYRYEVFTPQGKNMGGRHSSVCRNLKDVADTVCEYDNFEMSDCPRDCDCRET